MLRYLIPPLFLLAFAGCAGHTPGSPTLGSDKEKEFEVPANLADQFAVHEGGVKVAPPAPAPSAPIPAQPDPPKTAKGEKGDKKGSKKGKPGKTAAPAATPPARPVFPAEIPNRWSMTPFFRPGERTVFDITYFGATAGQLELEVLPEKTVANRPTYHFRAVASSTSIFSLFYRVNDVAESFMDTQGLFSHKFVIKLDESKQTRDVLELYDQDKRKAYYWSKLENQSGKHDDKSEIDLVPFTQDGLSSFFYVRTLPLEIGKTYEFPVVNNGKLRQVRVTAVRKEDLSTKTGEYHTIVVKPEVVLDGVLQSYGDSFMWISDDADRQILKIDAKIKVGSVIAYLRERTYGGRKAASASP